MFFFPWIILLPSFTVSYLFRGFILSPTPFFIYLCKNQKSFLKSFFLFTNIYFSGEKKMSSRVNSNYQSFLAHTSPLVPVHYHTQVTFVALFVKSNTKLCKKLEEPTIWWYIWIETEPYLNSSTLASIFEIKNYEYQFIRNEIIRGLIKKIRD